MEKLVKCPECGKLLKSTARHCGYCGAFDINSKGPLEEADTEHGSEYICYDCGEWVNADATYCRKCGGTVGKADRRPDVTATNTDAAASDDSKNDVFGVEGINDTFVGTNGTNGTAGTYIGTNRTYGTDTFGGGTASTTGGKKTFKPAGDL